MQLKQAMPTLPIKKLEFVKQHPYVIRPNQTVEIKRDIVTTKKGREITLAEGWQLPVKSIYQIGDEIFVVVKFWNTLFVAPLMAVEKIA